MKVIVYNDRDLNVIEEYSTQNENDFEVMEFKFSSIFDNYNKKIVFLTPDGNISYYINNNKFLIPREITQYDQVKFYIWCTFENKDFRTKLKILSFYKNENVNIDILPLEKTQIEQIINELEKNILIVQNLEKQTTNLINTVQTKLDNGDFKGDKGDKGDPGESYDDTEIKEEITDIKEEQTTQNTRIEELEEQVQELESNQLTGTATGQSIYIEDSTNAKVRDIGLSGNSEQESTTGKNIAYVTNTVGDKITFDDSQIITYSSGATASNFVNLEQNTLEANQEYIFEMFLTSTTQNTAQSELVLRDINNTVLFDIYRTINNSSLYYSYNFTPTADTTLYRLQLYNNTATPLTADIKFKLQIRKANTTGGYEPYTGGQASPNPSYPQEIHSTGDSGSVNEKVQNKNLASLKTSQETIVDGLPFIVDDGIIKINGTNTSTNSFFFDSFKAKSGIATFWLEITGYADKDSSNASIILEQSDDNINFSTVVEISFKSTIGKTRQVTLDSNKYYRIRLYVNKNTFTNSEIKVQLEYGNQKTTFVPHEEQTISFPLAQGQKLMQGDYLADDGVHHTMKQVIVSGTTATFSDAKNNGLYFCDQKVTGNLEGQTITFDTAVTNSIVQYELAEEVIEAYTEEQQAVWEQIKALRTYKPITHISSTDEVPATVNVTYVKDLETVINNLRGA